MRSLRICNSGWTLWKSLLRIERADARVNHLYSVGVLEDARVSALSFVVDEHAVLSRDLDEFVGFPHLHRAVDLREPSSLGLALGLPGSIGKPPATSTDDAERFRGCNEGGISSFSFPFYSFIFWKIAYCEILKLDNDLYESSFSKESISQKLRVLLLQLHFISLWGASKDALTELAQRSISVAGDVVPLSTGSVQLDARLTSSPVVWLTSAPVPGEERKTHEMDFNWTCSFDKTWTLLVRIKVKLHEHSREDYIHEWWRWKGLSSSCHVACKNLSLFSTRDLRNEVELTCISASCHLYW